MVGSNFMGASMPEGTDAFRYRMIALKPLFLLDQMEKTLEPVVFLDVDLEFHQFPELFQPAAPATWRTARDVLLWNWQANVSMFRGRRLKMASGVAFFNKTEPAEVRVRVRVKP